VATTSPKGVTRFCSGTASPLKGPLGRG